MTGSAEWRARGPLATDEIACVVVGTAGHIDHGKTTLVRALTGVDADRLAEEQDRGMTIDLGFAPLELEGRAVGIIDVPGHERFIKNMVAGATGIDLVMLVVAADDGVMPQTREHLEILTLLGLERGLVAITKVDRPGVDGELLEMLGAELDELLGGTFLAGAPRLRVSGVTGEGVEPLRAALARLVDHVPPRPTAGPFRMPVQRVFSVKGFGTVVTGTPVSGRVESGEALAVHSAKGARSGRVRGIQAYGRSVVAARAGHSAALNLADIDRAEVRRGDVVATPGVFLPGDLWEVRLQALGPVRRAFGKRTSVRVHLGTAEVLGEVLLLDARELQTGESGLAQLRLRAPITAAPGDRFVVRRHSPMATVGGGVVLARSRWRLKAFRPFVLERLARREAALGDLPEQALIELEASPQGLRVGTPELAEAAGSLGCPPAELEQVLRRLAEAGRALRVPGDLFVAGEEVVRRATAQAALQVRVQAAVSEAHREHPTRLGCTVMDLRRRVGVKDEASLSAALTHLSADGGPLRQVTQRGGTCWYAEREHTPHLPAAWRPLADGLLAVMRQDGTQPRARGQLELALASPPPSGRSEDVLEYLVRTGEALALGEVVIDQATYRASVAQVRALLAAGPGSLGGIRDALSASRRYAIALLEHLDRTHVTRRVGDQRTLREPDA